ncbi:MAG: hypothetical protein SD837_08685 [Candidatus Electrothrix scaldis]|nr:MAG: hypothetical protein SD837_08685 [Candidatus Electrothrix sp. GW3-3]
MIRQEDGSRKLVLIEIQKAKLPTDIMRFRKYLGGQYQDPNNVYPTEDDASEKALSRACSGTFPPSFSPQKHPQNPPHKNPQPSSPQLPYFLFSLDKYFLSYFNNYVKNIPLKTAPYKNSIYPKR